MTCPSCNRESNVLETREVDGGIRRRRRCLSAICGARFTTIEVIAPERRQYPGAAVIVVDKVRAAALRAAIRDLDELLGSRT